MIEPCRTTAVPGIVLPDRDVVTTIRAATSERYDHGLRTQRRVKRRDNFR